MGPAGRRGTGSGRALRERSRTGRVARIGDGHRGRVLHAGGPASARARRARGLRGDHAGVRASAAWLHRPAGRGAGRRDQDRGLQDRPCAAGGLRGQRAVPDEVLRPGDLAAARPGTAAAPAHVPGRRRGAALLPRRVRPARHRAQGCGAVEGHRAGQGRRRLAAAAEQAVRLVQPQGAVPGVRRHPAAAARIGARLGGAALPSGGHPRAFSARTVEWYDRGMTDASLNRMTKKIGISLRDDLYEWAIHEVEEGRAESVSALIAEGLQILEARAALEALVTDLWSSVGELDDQARAQLDEALRAADEAYRRHLSRKTEDAA